MNQDLYMVLVTGILLVIAFRYLNDNFWIYKKQVVDYVTDHRITNLENGQYDLSNKVNNNSARYIGSTATSLDYSSVYGWMDNNSVFPDKFHHAYQPVNTATATAISYEPIIQPRNFDLNTPPPQPKVVEKVVEKIVYIEKPENAPTFIATTLVPKSEPKPELESEQKPEPEPKCIKQSEDAV